MSGEDKTPEGDLHIDVEGAPEFQKALTLEAIRQNLSNPGIEEEE